MKRSFLFLAAGLILCYVLCIFRWGYMTGGGDLSEIMPYALWLRDHALFPKDYFIQNMSAMQPNERFPFAQLLALFPELWIEPAMLVMHFLCSVFLFAAVVTLASRVIQSYWLQLSVIPVMWVLALPFGAGSNDLWGNYLSPEMLACTAGLWAFVLALRKQWVGVAALCGLATILHPIVGLQIFILLWGTGFWLMITKDGDAPTWKQSTLSAIFFLASGGLYFFMLMKAYGYGSGLTGDPKTFYAIYHEFRAPHHYLSSGQRWQDWAVTGFFSFIALLVSKRRQPFIWHFTVFSIVIIGIFSVWVELLRDPSFASMQWLKATIWLKLVGSIGLMALLEMWFPVFKKNVFNYIWISGAGLLAASAFVIYIFFRNAIPWNVPYHFGNQRVTDPEIEICARIKRLTPNDALIMEPILHNNSMYYSERSSFVDYKCQVRRIDLIGEWARRMKIAYGLDYQSNIKGYAVFAPADSFYVSMDEDYLRSLKEKEGVTHILTYERHHLNFPLLASNKLFRFYEIE